MVVPVEYIFQSPREVSPLSAFYPYIIENSYNGVDFASWDFSQSIYNNELWNTSGELWFDKVDSVRAVTILERYSNEPWFPYIAKTVFQPDPLLFEASMKTLSAVNGNVVFPDSGSYSKSEGVSKFGLTAYIQIDYGYYLAGTPGDGKVGSGDYKYFQLSNYQDTVPDLSNSPIQFLYTFGEDLINTSDTVYSFLLTPVGGINLLSVIFGSGFLIFAGWVLFKWIIPI